MSVHHVPREKTIMVTPANSVSIKRFFSAVHSILTQTCDKRVAFDCEGVNLSRLGTLELVTICFPTKEVFLIDFQAPCSIVVDCVKRLFESQDITKIIHDCRMDCDALFHLRGIRVNNIHDTSCFHEAETGMENKNLNDVLAYNNIPPNPVRDKDVYKLNPNFWATRPMKQTMIEWASSDVDKLFNLANKQLSRIPLKLKAKAHAKSEDYSRIVVGMKVCDKLKVRNPGLFIGPRGVNIRRTEKELGVFCYQEPNGWFAYYSTDAALDRLKRIMMA
ncbi:hypothetical protein ACHAW6_010560 [Cyclotella cf. meneghiniana]